MVGTAAHAEGNAANGEKVFSRCKACHSYEKDAKPKIGPNLFGVVDRKCGTSADFAPRYSVGMKACAEKGSTWSEAELKKYIPDANTYLGEMTGKKGSAMSAQKLDPQQLEDVVAYLKTLK
ncbi:MAG: c-type cytochrome [Alphaproteobacteria bacterium]|nr:c-type cytochrome [Alphaproteobacteria bacterium]